MELSGFAVILLNNFYESDTNHPKIFEKITTENESPNILDLIFQIILVTSIYLLIIFYDFLIFNYFDNEDANAIANSYL